jgi:simple sugar transport system ATP-binding protein
MGEHLLELREISKHFGNVTALESITTSVQAGKVTCVLGDNGAGKSTLIKILSGVHQPSSGGFLIDGDEVVFQSPRDARAAGIATVFQDLAMAPLMSVWRNFFLGSEPMTNLHQRRWFTWAKWALPLLAVPLFLLVKSMDYSTKVAVLVALVGPVLFGLSYVIRWTDGHFARHTAQAELAKMGIDLPDIEQPVGTLSGGQRQSVAIARAVYFGARVLILDEPTSALGVKQSGVVLKYIRAAAERGLGVIFITHNPHHAYPVGDRFLLLNRGRSLGDFAKSEITREELTRLMAGGAELEALEHELSGR